MNDKMNTAPGAAHETSSEVTQGIAREIPSGTTPEIVPETADCSSHEPFALRVLGDSMEPEFPDGTIIIIDPSAVIENGCYVLAEINDDDLKRNRHAQGKTETGYIFRRFVVEEERYHLKPLNPGYAAIEIADRGAVKGVIVQKAGTRRRDRKHYL